MVGTYVDKRTSKAGKYRPWLLRAGVPLVILSALLFAPIPPGKVQWLSPLLFIWRWTWFILVNIPYGSLNASLTRDPESIDKRDQYPHDAGQQRQPAGLYLFPMFVQMAAHEDRSLKDTGFSAL